MCQIKDGVEQHSVNIYVRRIRTPETPSYGGLPLRSIGNECNLRASKYGSRALIFFLPGAFELVGEFAEKKKESHLQGSKIGVRGFSFTMACPASAVGTISLVRCDDRINCW